MKRCGCCRKLIWFTSKAVMHYSKEPNVIFYYHDRCEKAFYGWYWGVYRKEYVKGGKGAMPRPSTNGEKGLRVSEKGATKRGD